MDHANRGEAALKASQYDEAISHYNSAIKASPEAATYYLKRSIAYQRTSKYSLALRDAEHAVVFAVKRAKRELIAQGQLRRGIALYHLEKYGDAALCFDLAKKLDDKDKSTGMWEEKTKLKMKDLEGDDARKLVTIKEVPELKPTEIEETVPGKASSAVQAHIEQPNVTASINSAAPSESTPASNTSASQTPASKIRHDWYQNNETVTINLLAKSVPKDKASISIDATSISITFPLASGSSYDFSLEPLFARIEPASSTFRVLSTKIELVLKKEIPGQKWANLEGGSDATGGPSTAPFSDPARAAALGISTNATPAGVPSPYATRGGGQKNWDSIAKDSLRAAKAEVVKSHTDAKGDKKNKGRPEELDDDDDDEGGDDVNKFFKQIFKGADENTRKAMIKSYTESGGTALSTNWEEVSKKTVEVTPPEGMVAKKWEY